MEPREHDGMVDRSSVHSVQETVARIERMLHAKGITLFARIDHSGEAHKAGFEMRPTMLLIFGNPKGGTPLMLASPSSAIDLPLKLLVYEDASGQVWVSYNSPQYLRGRHHLPEALLANIGLVATLAEAAASVGD
jgi:uncharacterized protein (DUF302 family)